MFPGLPSFALSLSAKKEHFPSVTLNLDLTLTHELDRDMVKVTILPDVSQSQVKDHLIILLISYHVNTDRHRSFATPGVLDHE